MNNTKWIILAYAVLSGFMAEAYPQIGGFMLMLAIWLVRAWVIVKSDAIGKRTSKRFAYTVTGIVTILSLWFVWSLEAAGAITPQVATALYIANIFLVVMEVYIGIEQAPHPDSIELARMREEMQSSTSTVARLREEIASMVQGDAIVAKEVARIEKENETLTNEVQQIKQAHALELKKHARASSILASIEKQGAKHYKINGRHVIINAPAIASGEPVEKCIYIGNTPDQAHRRSKLNGQVIF